MHLNLQKKGIESLEVLSESEKKILVQLPLYIDYNAPGYPEMIEMIQVHAGFRAN